MRKAMGSYLNNGILSTLGIQLDSVVGLLAIDVQHRQQGER
jgi:hypothetical protein